MNDRELLEMAAKAAGVVGVWHQRGQCIHVTDCEGMSDIWWRPLEDDGDALRLAVKLRIDFYTGEDDGEAIYAGYFVRGSTSQSFAIERNAYPESARRAIVRAAAEIGRAMP